jgi:hypothetical protein
MNDFQVFNAPEITLPGPPDDKFHREQRAFFRLLPELLKTHRGQYVAVHEERVVESGATLPEVALRAYSQFGAQPMCITLVTERSSPPERIPHARIPSPLRPSR